MKVCTNLCYSLPSPDLSNERHELNAFDIIIILLMVMSIIRTCHNKLHCTLYIVRKASPHFTSKIRIVSRVDVLDDQGSSSFNVNSSFVRWRNFRMFLDTTSVTNHHLDKYSIYQNTIDNVLNLIMWISVVPHQVNITAIVKVAWIRRFLGKTHIHTPWNRQP